VVTATDVSADLDALLALIAEEIQLPPSLDEKARERYEALTEYLESTELARFPIAVYAQGSYRIGTTVKPLSGEEFDLDFVLELALPTLVTPGQLMEAVWSEIQRNGRYAGMIERRPSCIRLIYADEFHMDVVPAVPDRDHGGTAVLIPRDSRGVLVWHGTNPRGYAAWFESKAERRMPTKEMAVEPLPRPIPAAEKTPLQTAVQLYKRHHHVAVADEHLRTASVVLTTLTAQASGAARTLGEALSLLVEDLRRFEKAEVPPVITNPAASHEVVSDKWADLSIFRVFRQHTVKLRRDWEEVLQLQGRDYPALARKLSEMFGEPPVHRAFKAAESQRQAARATGLLAMGSGGILQIGSGTRPNPRHTYFGGGSE